MNPHEHVPHAPAAFHAYSAALAAAFLVLACVWYVRAARRTRFKHAFARSVCWCLGIACIAASLTGPLAERAHADFVAHMYVHLLLGMAGPLALTLAVPHALLLRSLRPQRARRVVRLLHARPIRLAGSPIAASLLNVGGLWLLYATPLYGAMLRHAGVHLLVHAHVFLAGFVFAYAFLAPDPSPHRPGFAHRAAVLWIATAAHGILSKTIYEHPPPGVAAEQAEAAARIMYYGGDLVHIAMIAILFAQRYRAVRPRTGTAGRRLPL